MHRAGARTRGFTIVELMVVIGIIALLVGMLVPALAGSIDQGRKRKELNALRQVGVAWTLYSNSAKDHTLPGYLERDVQERWKLSFEYPSRQIIPPAPSYSAGEPNVAGPWPWRLMSYLGNNHEMIHGHLSEPEYDASQLGRPTPEAVAEAREIAYEPSFGYNGLYVGGWWGMDPTANGAQARPRYFDATADVQMGDQVVNKQVGVVSKSVASISRSSELVVFCSSSVLDQGIYTKVADDRPGFHLVVPPWVGQEAQWDRSTSEDNSSIEVLGSLSDDIVPGGAGTAAPIGRYNRYAAVLVADGQTVQEVPGALANMRRWIDAAATNGFKHD